MDPEAVRAWMRGKEAPLKAICRAGPDPQHQKQGRQVGLGWAA